MRKCETPYETLFILILLTALLSTAPVRARHYAERPLAPGPAIPLPPKRPADITPPPKATEPPPSASETGGSDPACTRALASNKIVTSSIAPFEGSGGCGIAAPIKLTAIVLEDGTHVPLEPPATIRCTLAEALGDWVRNDIAPLADKTGSSLSKLKGSEGYECRPRNRVAGAKLSEHGKGNAYDLLGIVLRNGHELTIEHQTDAREFMAQLKSSSCARFMTVLGPGSDGYHESHLHVDLAERHSDYRICEWDLR